MGISNKLVHGVGVKGEMVVGKLHQHMLSGKVCWDVYMTQKV